MNPEIKISFEKDIKRLSECVAEDPENITRKWASFSMKHLQYGASALYEFLKDHEGTDARVHVEKNQNQSRMKVVSDLFFQEKIMDKPWNTMGRLAVSIMELAGKEQSRFMKGKKDSDPWKGKKQLKDRPLHFLTLQLNWSLYAMHTIDPLVKTAFVDNEILRRGLLTDGALFRGVVDKKTNAATITEGYNSHNLQALSDDEWMRIVSQVTDQCGFSFDPTLRTIGNNIYKEVATALEALQSVLPKLNNIIKKDALDEIQKYAEYISRQIVLIPHDYSTLDSYKKKLIEYFLPIFNEVEKRIKKGEFKKDGMNSGWEILRVIMLDKIREPKDCGGRWYYWPGCLFRIPSFVNILLDPDVDKTRLVIRRSNDAIGLKKTQEEQIIIDENNNALHISIVGNTNLYEKLDHKTEFQNLIDTLGLYQGGRNKGDVKGTLEKIENLKTKIENEETSFIKKFAPGFYVKSTNEPLDQKDMLKRRVEKGFIKDFDDIQLGLKDLIFYDVDHPLTVEKTITKNQFGLGFLKVFEKAFIQSLFKDLHKKNSKYFDKKIEESNPRIQVMGIQVLKGFLHQIHANKDDNLRFSTLSKATTKVYNPLFLLINDALTLSQNRNSFHEIVSEKVKDEFRKQKEPKKTLESIAKLSPQYLDKLNEEFLSKLMQPDLKLLEVDFLNPIQNHWLYHMWIETSTLKKPLYDSLKELLSDSLKEPLSDSL
ncbi:MAG TPA: hypothetical protein DCE41_00575, partial [Cytophagales bacterium]|nr:hypothetical protein [Cytophagales bacterium]HAA18548.1 hypothetical protein [Cytophagales bacterium]